MINVDPSQPKPVNRGSIRDRKIQISRADLLLPGFICSSLWLSPQGWLDLMEPFRSWDNDEIPSFFDPKKHEAPVLISDATVLIGQSGSQSDRGLYSCHRKYRLPDDSGALLIQSETQARASRRMRDLNEQKFWFSWKIYDLMHGT